MSVPCYVDTPSGKADCAVTKRIARETFAGRGDHERFVITESELAAMMTYAIQHSGKPDLLEALVKALSSLQTIQLSARLTGLERENIVIRCEAIQAAIAKAKGES